MQNEAIYFSTDERDYVAVPVDGGFKFNYTTRPYSMTGRRPVTNGSFFMPTAEAEVFIERNAR